jgi:predicted transcriptional regulator
MKLGFNEPRPILLSIKPEYAELILEGKKTIELRKSYPAKIFSKIYLYATAPVKKVVGVVYQADYPEEVSMLKPLTAGGVCVKACVTSDELREYIGDSLSIYGWKLKDPKRFKTPKAVNLPIPQSWRYIKRGESY